MAKCFLHPGRNAVVSITGKSYCQQCKSGQQAAAARVAQDPHTRHVEPKACFVTYRGGDTWDPLSGTGCAHWVAHQLDLSGGSPSNRCIEGHMIRVPDLVAGKRRVTIDDVKVNDIWANDALNHTGLVSDVQKPDGGEVQVMITHDSSGQGGVATNDFGTYFSSGGSFYR